MLQGSARTDQSKKSKLCFFPVVDQTTKSRNNQAAFAAQNLDKQANSIPVSLNSDMHKAKIPNTRPGVGLFNNKTQNVQGIHTKKAKTQNWFNIIKTKTDNGIVDVTILQETHVTATNTDLHERQYARVFGYKTGVGQRSFRQVKRLRAEWPSLINLTQGVATQNLGCANCGLAISVQFLLWLKTRKYTL